MGEIFVEDEESMIPKGLLDTAWGKSDEENLEFQNTNSSNNIGPCYVAVLSPEQIRSMEERYQYGPVQNNGMPMYPPNPPHIIPHFGTPPGNECYFQIQRNPTSLNSGQTHRQYQDSEYIWWTHFRANQNYLSQIPGNERSPNNVRSNNALHSERIFVPLQQVNYTRNPIEYNQRLVNMNTFGYDPFQSPIPFSTIPVKAILKNNCKVDKDTQTDTEVLDEVNPHSSNTNSQSESTQCTADEFISLECKGSNQVPNCLNIEATSTSSEDHKNEEESQTQHSNTKIRSLNNAAYFGCLQLEQLLKNKGSKLTTNVDLRQYCLTLKADLKKTKALTTEKVVFQEMCFAFFEICYSWLSLNALKSCRNIDLKLNFESFSECIDAWENNSKTLIINMLSALENIPIEEPVIKILKNNLSKSKSSETEDNQGCNKKSTNHLEVSDLNYNWRRSIQASPKNFEKNEDAEFSFDQLIPESHKSTSESSFAYDNFMKSLKNVQERNNKSWQKLENLRTKQVNSQKSRHTFVQPENSSMDKFMRKDSEISTQYDSFEKLYQAYEKRANSNVSKATNSPRLSDDSIYEQTSEKSAKRHVFLENLSQNSSDGSTIVDSERNSKYNFHSSLNSPFKLKLEMDAERPGSKTSNTKVKGKRYSQQCKKNTNFGNKHAENSKKSEYLEITSRTKLKLYETLVGIQVSDLRNNTNEKLSDHDDVKLRQSLMNYLSHVAESLVRNSYRTVDEIVGIILSKFYQAKIDNKGNMALLTMANQLEIKLMNNIYTELGT